MKAQTKVLNPSDIAQWAAKVMPYNLGHQYPGKGVYLGIQGKRHKFKRHWHLFKVSLPWYHFEKVDLPP